MNLTRYMICSVKEMLPNLFHSPTFRLVPSHSNQISNIHTTTFALLFFQIISNFIKSQYHQTNAAHLSSTVSKGAFPSIYTTNASFLFSTSPHLLKHSERKCSPTPQKNVLSPHIAVTSLYPTSFVSPEH